MHHIFNRKSHNKAHNSTINKKAALIILERNGIDTDKSYVEQDFSKTTAIHKIAKHFCFKHDDSSKSIMNQFFDFVTSEE